MSGARQPIERIAIAGAGPLGALTALAMRRALTRCEITVIGTPQQPGALADIASSALPSTNRLHDRLGITEDELVRLAGASHRLITRSIGWGAGEGVDEVQTGAFAYSAASDPALQTGFATNWGGGPKNTTAQEAPGSLAQVLAEAGRFQPPSGGAPTPLDHLDYCLRWNPQAYHQLLVQRVQQANVQKVDGSIAALERDDSGNVMAAVLEGGARIAADLFIDCSGPAGAFVSNLEDSAWEDWSEFLPIRSIAYAMPLNPTLALEDRFSLLDKGWMGEFAGRDAMQRSYASAETALTDEAMRVVGADGGAGSIAIAPARRRDVWSANVIAIGDSSTVFEPLGYLNLDLAHRQLELLLEMLPGLPIVSGERAEFNRRCALMQDNVRDVLGVHYASPRGRELFPDLKQSAVLTELLDQYARRGRLVFAEESVFPNEVLRGLLSALGMHPGLSPIAVAADPGAGEAARAAFERNAAAALKALPPYGQWIAAQTAAGQTPRKTTVSDQLSYD